MRSMPSTGSASGRTLRRAAPSGLASLAAAVACLAGPAPAHAQAPSLQDVGRLVGTPAPVVIYRAREIVTLDPARPVATAVAVDGDRILATGSVSELQASLRGRQYRIDDTLADRVIVPGFVAQHDHPLLAALTMTAEIIAIEDWVLPDGVRPAAKDHADYLRRLAAAHARLADPDELLLTWGYHHYFHGELQQSELDAISSTRPIIVWHRSGHEFYLNSAAERRYGVTKAWFDGLSASQRAQSDFDEGHYWEQGWFAVGPLTLKDIASPARVKRGLEFVRDYFHANGVTIGAEPGGVSLKAAQDAQNEVLSDPASPLRWYYIADGKSLTAAHPDERVIAETEKLLSWGRGMTAYLPRQVKLFADGAIFSQAMQVRDGYADGHRGEWMMDPDFFARTFRVYWDAGYQLHVHVNGDAGLDMVLDQLERNLARKPRTDHRTVIVHFAVSRPEQVERIRQLGAIVSGNPYYPVALADNYRSNGLDPQRADPMVRMGDVARAGIRYSFHSDMPMAPGQPLFLMWSGVNRITNAGNLRGPEQRVDRLGALKAVTLDAAYSLQLDKQVGSIEPGKLANLTILSANPLSVDPMKIREIAVWGTMLEGRLLPVPTGAARAGKPDARPGTATIPVATHAGGPVVQDPLKYWQLASARRGNDAGECSNRAEVMSVLATAVEHGRRDAAVGP